MVPESYEVPSTLPAATTPFVGRNLQIRQLIELISDRDARLVTILAPGGMGKTRLALEVAARLGQAYVDGVFFVPLAALSSPDMLVHAIAENTDYRFQPDSRDPFQQLLDFLRPKALLLVLDNFEHLLEAAPQVTQILQAAPEVAVLVTSRERLNLNSETVYNISGMSYPLDEAENNIWDYEAAQLFQQSVHRVQPNFDFGEADQPLVARICQLVEGMPLALMLAAAWIEVLPLSDIAEEISSSIDFLSAEMRDAPQRQWSIQAVFEPTWNRLSDSQRAVLMKLSVFKGGFTRRAAQHIAGASLPVMYELVNKTLVVHIEEDRYTMHELLRQVAEQKLIAYGEVQPLYDAHCAYYADAMRTRLPDLKGARQLETLHDIEIDLENVRAAWQRAI